MGVVTGGGGGGGGYTAPITRQQLNGALVAINNGATGALTWNSSFGPNVLLDRTDLSKPAFLTAGVYCVTVEIVGSTLTVGGRFTGNLQMDFDNEDANISASAASSIAAETSPHVAMSMTYYVAAGGTMKVLVTNEDGAAQRSFNLSAVIQRIS